MADKERGDRKSVDPRSGTKSQSKTACLRPKCNRRHDLNENGICGGHCCAYPYYVCKNTKSNTEDFCEIHKTSLAMDLPKKWAKVEVNKVFLWLNIKTQVAQFRHPGEKAINALPRLSKLMMIKPKKGAPTHFIVSPQPPDLPDPWEQILAVPDMGKKTDYDNLTGIGALFLYTNTADRTVQFSDPRPPPKDPNALPEGWEKGFDKDGDVYYINLDTDLRTYDDPRIVATPVASRSLSSESQRETNPFMRQDHNNPRPPPALKAKQPTKTKPLPAVVEASRDVEKEKKKEKKRGPPMVPDQWSISKCDMTAYEMLDDCLTFEDEIPQAARNKIHNRYMDILPNPKTIVTLPKRPHPTNRATEYINANWVAGPDGNERFYIAAMGPKPTTVDNFWRMLWKVKPIAIVMITGLIEKGVAKCERYWPGCADGKEILEFGDVRVCTTQSTPKHGYVRSTIKAVSYETLDVKGKLVSHTMEHFWYNTWPDHGVPRSNKNPLYVDDALAMLREVNAYASKKKKKGMNGPIVVHCSAGIGRTGTYMCIDHCLYNLENTGECDPVAITAQIRQYRAALVQHPQQFSFAHHAAVEYARIKGKELEILNMDDNVDDVENSDEQRKIEKAESYSRSQSQQEVTRNKRTGKGRVSGLTMGTISFEGKQHEFIDPDGNGKMDLKEACDAGFPRGLFRLLDKNKDGFVTPTEFKTYQRLQKQAAAAKRSTTQQGQPLSRMNTATAAPHKQISREHTDQTASAHSHRQIMDDDVSSSHSET